MQGWRQKWQYRNPHPQDAVCSSKSEIKLKIIDNQKIQPPSFMVPNVASCCSDKGGALTRGGGGHTTSSQTCPLVFLTTGIAVKKTNSQTGLRCLDKAVAVQGEVADNGRRGVSPPPTRGQTEDARAGGRCGWRRNLLHVLVVGTGAEVLQGHAQHEGLALTGVGGTGPRGGLHVGYDPL